VSGFFIWYSRDGPSDAQRDEQKRKLAASPLRSRIDERLADDSIFLLSVESTLELSSSNGDVRLFKSLNDAMVHAFDRPLTEIASNSVNHFMRCLEKTGPSMSVSGFYVWFESEAPHAKARLSHAARLGIAPPVNLAHMAHVESMVDELVRGWQQEISDWQGALPTASEQMRALIALKVGFLEEKIAKFAQHYV
jgi:hypothetical protein